MAPLISLVHNYPLININFIQFCASQGIYSVEDFLLQDTNALIASAEKQFRSGTLKQSVNQIFSLLDGVHWSNGVELLASKYDDECPVSERWERKKTSIGAFLHGGLREGFITELVCLLAAVSVASVTRSGAVYIDTGNSFSARRVAKLVNRDTTTKDPRRTIGHVMSSISCYHVFDVFTLFDVLDQIESKLKFQVQTNQDLIKLLIVDSMSSLITPVLGGSGPNGHALMISLGYHLKKLAIEYNLSVLVTNHMVGGGGGHSKPALGESWKTVPHVRILLSRDKESNICNMSLLRHPSMVCSLSLLKHRTLI
ncbi:hypothetical protein V2J09_006299 [Rumex salicifolius]